MKRKGPFFLGLSVILLVLTVADIYAISHPQQLKYGSALVSQKLSMKPEKYVVVADPDPYLLEALSNSGTAVFVGSFEKTNVDELVWAQGTDNLEYNNVYYAVNLLSVDNFFYHRFFLILLFSWVVLGVSFVRAHRVEVKNTEKEEQT